jgi:single-strand DNA-binding protein
MSANTMTVAGNLTADPELRHTHGGRAVANFTVADTPRHRDPETREWKDGETLYQRVAVWDALAENVAHSITKGTRVVVTGTIHAKSFTGNDGEKRNYAELIADEVGASLRFATAAITRATQANR